MRQKTEEELKQNYTRFIGIINKYFTGERLEKLLHMYSESELGINLTLAPASGNVNYHNAYIGGYIDHIFNVTKNALRMKETFAAAGGEIDFTDEELVFTALNHDLGKIGFQGQPNYLPQTDQWRKEKLQELYTNNKDLSFMLIQDRSMFILQQNGIKMSEKEFLAIKLHDGLYDDANKPYYMSFNPDSKLRTNLVYILHQADFLASKIEYDRWKNAEPSAVVKTYTSTGKKAVTSVGLLDAVKNA